MRSSAEAGKLRKRQEKIFQNQKDQHKLVKILQIQLIIKDELCNEEPLFKQDLTTVCS